MPTSKQRELSWLDYTYPGESVRLTARHYYLTRKAAADHSLTRSRAAYTYGVYIRKTDGSPAVLLGEGNALALSPDGKWAITETQVSPSQLKLLPTGAGQSKDLTHDNINHNWAHWFPDGKRILFSGNEPNKGEKLYVTELDSGKSQAVTPEGVNGNTFAISPDSQLVAAIGPDQRGYLYPINGGEPRLIAGLNPGEQPITWASDGKSLYIYQPGELPARVFRIRGSNWTAHFLERAHAHRSCGR